MSCPVFASVELMAESRFHPRIILVDLKDRSSERLQKEGYHVSSGSFGTPYLVPKGHDYLPIVSNGVLSDYEAHDVVVVDLVPGKPRETAPDDGRKPSRGIDWWANLHKGVIDPRPKMMVSVRRASEEILARGGVFVIFTDVRERRDMKWGHTGDDGKFVPVGDIRYTTWDFLPALSSKNIDIRSEYVQEIIVSEEQYPMSKILSEHVPDAEVFCTLHPAEKVEWESWSSLATNKGGAPVALSIAVSPKKKLGWIFLFPQIKDKAEFLLRILREVLPELAPALFSGSKQK